MAEPKLIVTIDPLVPLVLAAQNESGFKNNMKVVKTRRTADSLSDNVLPMVTMSDDPTSSAMPFEQFTDNDGADYDKRLD